ncbi:MAG: hypothetical protein ABFD25_03240 [Clostridiaceae bacterium]
MSIFGKKTEKVEEKKPIGSPHNTQAENELLCEIDNKQTYAEGGERRKIEVCWDDEYKICQGGGQQWDTSKAPRSERGKKRNFNSEDNFVHPTIQNMLAPFSTAPSMEASGVEPGDDSAAEIVSDLIAHVFYQNKFPEQYDKICTQMVKYGPVIGYVPWDQHWIGGSGPNRWVGEIRTSFMDRRKFYSDPAILNLEERLQECSFINIVERKKLQWFADTWPEKGKYVIEDSEGIIEGQENEGTDPQQAALITHFHKGLPKFVSDEWKQIFLEKAQEAEQVSLLPYYAKDLRDMAAGTLKGVHCAFKANTILLDYIPYIYDDGLYPFVYKVLYTDEKQPWGMGEIRNVISPQINHNKADEIELGAMLGQGLGGAYYDKGSISETQKDEILDSMAKANAWNEVNNANGIHEKKAVQVPSSITNYKDSKKNIIDTVSGNTAIMQGISPGANVPYSTIAELGARADARTRHKAKVLERFMIEFTQLIINRIVQFYTVERKYRILGDRQVQKAQEDAYKTLQQIASMPAGTPPEQQIQAIIDLLMRIKQQQDKPKTGIFKREMLVRTWDREYMSTVDEYGNEIKKPMKEEFVPEFDLRAKIMDERPTDRNYYTSLATQLLGSALGIRAFWRTLDEGKFPPVNEILQELDEMRQAQAQAAQQQQQTMIQSKQQEKEQDKQASLEKIALQNQSMEKQVAMSAMAKAGAR